MLHRDLAGRDASEASPWFSAMARSQMVASLAESPVVAAWAFSFAASASAVAASAASLAAAKTPRGFRRPGAVRGESCANLAISVADAVRSACRARLGVLKRGTSSVSSRFFSASRDFASSTWADAMQLALDDLRTFGIPSAMATIISGE